MIASRKVRTALLLVTASFIAQPAWAQSASDKTMAETLFRDGKKLMDQGKYPEACPKLAESQKLDPGGGTLLNLAICHHKEGKTATAWSEYTEALSIAKRDAHKVRTKIAQDAIAEIEPLLSKLTIVVPQGSETKGLEVRLDDHAVPKAAWGVATPVDPGAHVVTAVAPGKKDYTEKLNVGIKADPKTVTVPALEDEKVAAPEPSPAIAPVAALPPPAPAAPPPEVRHGTGRTLAFVAGGVGVVGLGVGTYLALHAKSLRSQSDDQCTNGCTQEGVDLNDRARSSANLANIPFAIGVVGIGAAVVLFVTSGDAAPSATTGLRVDPAVAPGVAGATLRGAF